MQTTSNPQKQAGPCNGSKPSPAKADRTRPWSENDVLSLKGFPLASTLKWKSAHRCTCKPGEKHRDLLELNQVVGRPFLLSEQRTVPKIKVCWNATNLFEDKLPRKLTGLSERKAFSDLPNVGSMISVLYNGTYWYKRMACMKRQANGLTPRPVRLLYRLLAGIPKDEHPSLHELHKMKPNNPSVQRFVQAISTIDGVLVQLATAFPDQPQIQNWDYFDNAIHCLMCHLIEDYSPGKGPDYVSLYEKLKTLRKNVKRYAFHASKGCESVNVPRELSFMRRPIRAIKDKTLLSAFRAGILCQTRASGTPPPHFQEKSFLKFKDTVTTPCLPLLRERSIQIAVATRTVWGRLVMNQPDLRRKIEDAFKTMKISLSDSADLYVPHNEGGKYEAFRLEVVRLRGQPVYVTDWNTGRPTKELIEETPVTSGERVFHSAFQRVMRDEIPDIMTVRAVGVPEAGKVREITVSHFLHAALLHPIAHLLIEVLKLIPQAATGVGAANHAWEFFKRLAARNPAAGFVFSGQDLFVLSTDLETATDVIHPQITRTMLGIFFGKFCLNIPAAYGAVVSALLTKPRTVLSRYSEPFETTRGIFMGDPGTKFVLHLHHLVGDEIVQSYLQKLY